MIGLLRHHKETAMAEPIHMSRDVFLRYGYGLMTFDRMVLDIVMNEDRSAFDEVVKILERVLREARVHLTSGNTPETMQ